MEISTFIIKSNLDAEDKVLLYNTRTTALIKIDNQLYNKVFIDKDFSDTKLIQQLYTMGFVVKSHEEELEILDAMRMNELDNPTQSVVILPTRDCNARCFYCFEEGLERYSMTKETATHTVDFIKKFYDRKELSIVWFGGEPLMNFPMIEYITRELNKYSYEINTLVVTNGSLLTHDILEFFVSNYKHVVFQITLDGIDKKYSDVKRYRDITPDEAFNRVIGNIKMVLRANIPIQLRVNFLTSKIDEAKHTYEYILGLLSDVDTSNLYIYMAPLDVKNDNEIISRFSCKDTEHPYLKLVKTQFNAGFPVNSIVGEKNNKTRLLRSFNIMPKCASCGITPHKRIIVDADGTLYKCHRLSGRKEWSTGNVVDGVNTECYPYRYFSSPFVDDDNCKKCNILPLCHGGCRANNIIYGHKHRCHDTKQVQSEMVRLYYNELMKENK